jgi:type IV secretion system protein VirB8
VNEQRSPISGPRRREYEQAASWAADIQGALRASRRTAWIIAAVAVAVAALEALALAALAPLKQVVPYTILVDRQTGYVETVHALKPGLLSQDSAVTQSFMVQYVLARETFDATDLRENYRKTLLWSAGEAGAQYRQAMERSNPASPLNLYPPTSIVSVTIKSVSLLSPTTALVRFDTTRRDGGSTTGEQRAYTAAIAFRYTGAPMRMEDRFINPLGFQVTRYRRDDESTAGVGPGIRLGGPGSPLP